MIQDLTLKKGVYLKYTLWIFILVISTKTNAQVNEWSKQPSLNVYYTPLKLSRYNFSQTMIGLEYNIFGIQNKK